MRKVYQGATAVNLQVLQFVTERLIMPKPFKQAKMLISASVSQESRLLLEQTSTATKQTMSDILDNLIKTAFKPKRGLAKRIDKDKAEAKAKLLEKSEALRIAVESALVSAVQELQAALTVAENKRKLAKETYSKELEVIASATDLAIQNLESEWSNSFQAKLIWMSEQDWAESGEDAIEHLSFWLFSRRVFAMRDKSGKWTTGLGLAKACHSWMKSSLLTDKLLAADLAAESETSDCPEDVYTYLIDTFYDGSEAKAFAEFCRRDTEAEDYIQSFSTFGFSSNLNKASELFSGLEQVIDTRKQYYNSLLAAD